MYFYELVNQNRHLLNHNEEKLLSYFIQNKEYIRSITINKASQDNFIAQNTIVRFCKKLGFSGYSSFKEALFLVLQEDKSFVDCNELDIQIQKTKQILNNDTINTIIDLIHTSNRILVLAVGLSRICANELNERLQMIGLNSQTHIDPHFMRYNCTMLNQNDLVIAFSISGETKTIIESVNIAALNQAQTVSITGFSNNLLSRITTYQLYALTSNDTVKGIDVSDRLSFSYIANSIFLAYINKYLKE